MHAKMLVIDRTRHVLCHRTDNKHVRMHTVIGRRAPERRQCARASRQVVYR